MWPQFQLKYLRWRQNRLERTDLRALLSWVMAEMIRDPDSIDWKEKIHSRMFSFLHTNTCTHTHTWKIHILVTNKDLWETHDTPRMVNDLEERRRESVGCLDANGACDLAEARLPLRPHPKFMEIQSLQLLVAQHKTERFKYLFLRSTIKQHRPHSFSFPAKPLIPSHTHRQDNFCF